MSNTEKIYILSIHPTHGLIIHRPDVKTREEAVKIAEDTFNKNKEIELTAVRIDNDKEFMQHEVVKVFERINES